MIDWTKHGFRPDCEYPGLYYRDFFPMAISVQNDFLNLYVNLEYCISKGQIPATDQSIVLLLKAFALIP